MMPFVFLIIFSLIFAIMNALEFLVFNEEILLVFSFLAFLLFSYSFFKEKLQTSFDSNFEDVKQAYFDALGSRFNVILSHNVNLSVLHKLTNKLEVYEVLNKFYHLTLCISDNCTYTKLDLYKKELKIGVETNSILSLSNSILEGFKTILLRVILTSLALEILFNSSRCSFINFDISSFYYVRA